MFYIVTDPTHLDSPVVATASLISANRVNTKNFAGEGIITRVTLDQLRAEGFNPAEVIADDPNA